MNNDTAITATYSLYDIAKLREAGQLNEAYTAIQSYYPEHVKERNCANQYGWILSDLACAAAEKQDIKELCRILEETCAISIDKSTIPPMEHLAWGLLKMLRMYAEKTWNDYAVLDVLIAPLTLMHYHEGSKVASLICSGVCKVKNWKRAGELLIVLANYLLQDDYLPYKSPTTGRKIMSLAENANCKICNWLLQTAPQDEVEKFLPTQCTLIKAHPEYTYPTFYLAKMLLKCGRNEEAIRELKPFARQKSGEFWVWELLGDAQETIEESLPYYSKALLCRTKEEFLVKLYEKVGLVFAQAEQYPMAHTLLDKAIEIRKSHGWHAGYNLQEATRLDWYKQSRKADDYQHILAQTAEEAEIYLYGENKVFQGVLRINAEKGFGFVEHIYVDRKLVRKLQDGTKVK
ncbi:MAG: hypothetical protein SOW50_03440, partial [Lachnospiraceae bacterium]|nr:hypothetical protein [Lachnospiraceae bacterium]